MVVEMLTVLGLRNKEVATDLGLTETAVAGIKFRVLGEWRTLTQASPQAHEWQETDLAQDSTVARIWREEGISCLKRSTLGRFLLGVLDDEWNFYIDFHANQAGCARCLANLDDLRAEDERDEAERSRLRELGTSRPAWDSSRIGRRRTGRPQECSPARASERPRGPGMRLRGFEPPPGVNRTRT